jgi:hypothetical protein
MIRSMLAARKTLGMVAGMDSTQAARNQFIHSPNSCGISFLSIKAIPEDTSSIRANVTETLGVGIPVDEPGAASRDARKEIATVMVIPRAGLGRHQR